MLDELRNLESFKIHIVCNGDTVSRSKETTLCNGGTGARTVDEGEQTANETQQEGKQLGQ